MSKIVRRKINGRTNGVGMLWLTRAYNFIDKNPEIDRFRTVYQREHIKENDLAAMAGLAVTTVKNMFGGVTKDPRHSTFAKIAGGDALQIHIGA
jgi:hypothetical protein